MLVLGASCTEQGATTLESQNAGGAAEVGAAGAVAGSSQTGPPAGMTAGAPVAGSSADGRASSSAMTPAAGTSGRSGSAASGGAMASGGAGGSDGSTTAGTSAGASGTAGTSPASDFRPCPDTSDCKILPLGDSITDGIGSPGGYRVPLFQLALMNQKHLTFVGGSKNGPMMVDGQPFPQNHEGHSGWTIAQIDELVPEPALSVGPAIILLHIGTNDMYMSPEGAPDRLAALIDQIVASQPDALLVVAKIIPLSSGGSGVTTFNDAIAPLVQERIDAGKHIILIDQFTDFPTSELGDGVHPNQAGYERMADKWYAAIASYLH